MRISSAADENTDQYSGRIELDSHIDKLVSYRADYRGHANRYLDLTSSDGRLISALHLFELVYDGALGDLGDISINLWGADGSSLGVAATPKSYVYAAIMSSTLGEANKLRSRRLAIPTPKLEIPEWSSSEGMPYTCNTDSLFYYPHSHDVEKFIQSLPNMRR